MSCSPPTPVFVPRGDGAAPGDEPSVVLVDSDMFEVPNPTLDREVGARDALARGLVEYLQGLQVAGAPLFRGVFAERAEPEQLADYPSAVVSSDGVEGAYADSRLGGGGARSQRVVVGDFALSTPSEFTIDLRLEVWANPVEGRRQVVLAVEEALDPVTFMSGFRLVLPFYFSAVAEYEARGMVYLDTEEDGIRRYRRAVFVVRGRVPKVVVVRAPAARFKLKGTQVT